MMQTKISKTLETIIARAAFSATKAGSARLFRDYLALELLAEEGSLAYQLLATRLKDWEIAQVRLRLERELLAAQMRPQRRDLLPEAEYRTFEEELRGACKGVCSVSTIHALQAIVADRGTETSRIMEMYGVVPASLEAPARRLAAEEQRSEPRPEEPLRGRSRDEEHEAAPLRPLDDDLFRAASEPSQLEKFGTDLTQQARQGHIDPVVGRESEIERLVQILSRRKKNNPILVGEAGVGKSAVVEGLALRIAAGEVPATLAGKRIFSLDVSALVAGTKFRGEFEERMQRLIEELRRAQDTILFIDEIHTIVGAGSTQGGLDTANILKPALARGEVQAIGATTLDEYRTSFEADAALERRFQKIIIEPATADQTLAILRRLAPRYERHHGVRYSDEALQACVALADRYLTDRHFPDKAVDLLDEAGARARLDAVREPAALREMEGELADARRECREAVGAMVYERATEARIRELHLRARIAEDRSAWRRRSSEGPATLTAEHIRQTVTAITGIPAERISGDEMARLRTLRDHLSSRVVGQEEAVERIARTIRRSRAGIRDEHRPIGVFLFTGPTGVGKTLLAKEVSKWLFDGDRGLIRIDMSEYSEKHNVARLFGAPPGYVGYGEGGQLTEAVRRQPYSVVLFDEIEKAHPEVFDAMLQIFDEGHLTDGSGRRVDFRNTIIVMTSNVGSQAAAQQPRSVGYGTPSRDAARQEAPQEAYRRALEETFSPEFLNRIDDIVTFRTLECSDVERIVELELAGLLRRTERLGYRVRVTDAARRRLATMGYERRYGVRSLRRTLADQVEEPLSSLIIDGKLREGDTVVVEAERPSGVRLRVA